MMVHSASLHTQPATDGPVVARWPVKVSWIYEHTHRGQRTQMAGTYGLTTTNTKAEGFEAVLDEIERQAEWVLKRSPNTKTVITITLDADSPTTTPSDTQVGTSRKASDPIPAGPDGDMG